jgi:hypothetical protein
MPGSRTRESFYLWIAIAMSVTAFLGFSFTYFRPLYRGEFRHLSKTVHVHGWSFFAWYLLLPAQAALIRARQVKVHRALGISSAVFGLLTTIRRTVRRQNRIPGW